MKIYLLRHGQTAGNVEKRYVGSTDETILETSRLQIKQGIHPDVDLVICSPMKRCIETAQAAWNGKELAVVDELRECSFGDFEYKNYKELTGNTAYQAWIDSGGVIGFPGGEDRETFCGRSLAGFQKGIKLAEAQKAECTAFVVHGGTIMAVLDALSIPHQDYYNWQPKNAAGYMAVLKYVENENHIVDQMRLEKIEAFSLI